MKESAENLQAMKDQRELCTQSDYGRIQTTNNSNYLNIFRLKLIRPKLLQFWTKIKNNVIALEGGQSRLTERYYSTRLKLWPPEFKL